MIYESDCVKWYLYVYLFAYLKLFTTIQLYLSLLLSSPNDFPVIGVRGNSLTLRCPIDSSDSSTARRIRKKWFKMDNNKEKRIAQLEMLNSLMEYNDTTRGDVWISFPHGDLTIQNLRHVDAGVYKCSFTGSRDKFITLVVTGGLIILHVYGFLIDKLISNGMGKKMAHIYCYNILRPKYALFATHK